jgi:hypothetical protein
MIVISERESIPQYSISCYHSAYNSFKDQESAWKCAPMHRFIGSNACSMHATATIFDVQYLTKLKESKYFVDASMFEIYLAFQ